MEKLVKFFTDNGVALQLTIQNGFNSTVHAFRDEEGLKNLHKTEGATIEEALEKMKEKLFREVK
jgi:hypothetical protein